VARRAALDRGRELAATGACGDAYDALTRAERAAPLDAADLEAVATAAYMLGRGDEFLGRLEQAHRRHLEAADPCGRCAARSGSGWAVCCALPPPQQPRRRAHALSHVRPQGATPTASTPRSSAAPRSALAAEMDRSNLTLRDLTLDGSVRGAWGAHAATLPPASRAKYAWALEHHLADLGHEPLLALDVPALAAHHGLMLKRGATPSTVREVLRASMGRSPSSTASCPATRRVRCARCVPIRARRSAP
jgi:hypothetical protein